MASTDLVTISDADVEAALLDGVALPEVEDPEAISRAILSRILGASDEEDVFQSQDATPAMEVLDVPLKALGVRWQRSAYEDGAPVFAVMDAVDGNGERLAITCGSKNVMAQLYRLGQLSAFPTDVVIRKASKPTRNGFYPLWLGRPETFA